MEVRRLCMREICEYPGMSHDTVFRHDLAEKRLPDSGQMNKWT